jgi:hypothetical protein
VRLEQREDKQMDSAQFAFDGKTVRIGYSLGVLPCALAAVVALACGAGTAAAQNEEEAKNTRLVGHDDLQARSAYQPVIHNRAANGSPMSATTAVRR